MNENAKSNDSGSIEESITAREMRLLRLDLQALTKAVQLNTDAVRNFGRL